MRATYELVPLMEILTGQYMTVGKVLRGKAKNSKGYVEECLVFIGYKMDGKSMSEIEFYHLNVTLLKKQLREKCRHYSHPKRTIEAFLKNRSSKDATAFLAGVGEGAAFFKALGQLRTILVNHPPLDSKAAEILTVAESSLPLL